MTPKEKQPKVIYCMECGRDKPRADFMHKHDLTPYCKACRNNPQKDLRGTFKTIEPRDKTCEKCSQKLPIEMFRPSVETLDGYRSECRDCDVQPGKYYAKFEKAQPFIPMIRTHKTCSTCASELSLSKFQRDTSSSDGYAATCRGCLAKLAEEPRKPEVAPEGKACTKCKDVKSYSEFYKWSRSKDGHQAWCKSCSTASRSRPKEAAPQEGETMPKQQKKLCTRCKAEKLHEDFSKSRSAKDGLQYWCKECVKDSRNPSAPKPAPKPTHDACCVGAAFKAGTHSGDCPTIQPPAVPDTIEPTVETPDNVEPVTAEEKQPVSAEVIQEPLFAPTSIAGEEIPPDEMVLVVARLLQDERNLTTDLRKQIVDKDSVMDQMTSEIQKLQGELATANEYVESRDEDVRKRDEEIVALKAQIEELQKHVKVKSVSQYRPETKDLLGNLGVSVVR